MLQVGIEVSLRSRRCTLSQADIIGDYLCATVHRENLREIPMSDALENVPVVTEGFKGVVAIRHVCDEGVDLKPVIGDQIYSRITVDRPQISRQNVGNTRDVNIIAMRIRLLCSSIFSHRELFWTMNGGRHMTSHPPGFRLAHAARKGIRHILDFAWSQRHRFLGPSVRRQPTDLTFGQALHSSSADQYLLVSVYALL